MRAIVIGCFIALLVMLAVPAAASPREIRVEVTSIAAATRPASERGEVAVELDPRLGAFSKNLRSLFAYDSYTFLSKDSADVEFSDASVFRLPEHFSIEVAPEQLGRDGSDMIEMLVTLFREKPREERGQGRGAPEREVILRTKIRLKNGGTVLLGGPPIRGGVLVLALTARG
ncbi:MAG: hypothetical protein U9Q95_00900 [Candidatus Eisenbacteria bacterium]|nr:hypothetical protein [Candidatus Eisenbacteria bacterium]